MTETKAERSATLIQSANKDAAAPAEPRVKETILGTDATATQTKNPPASDLGITVTLYYLHHFPLGLC
jgi:hypothetical protein